jgi:L-lactate dehydrogenase complex protein LldF
MTSSPVTFRGRIQDAFSKGVPVAIDSGSRGLYQRRLDGSAAFPQMDEMRDRAREIRAHTLLRLDHYLGQFADAVERGGGKVFFAADAVEANDYIARLAEAAGVARAVKVKSMVTEEIHLNSALEKAGVEVVETDLGEFIIQLAGETPSHIIAPVMHKDRYDVGKLFAAELGVDYTHEPTELNDIARAHLRERFLTADMGISGVNFAVAADGSIALVTNEGNGRITTTVPRIHVAVMGMERIVPTRDELVVMLEVLARSATGQKLSVYTNLIGGARRDGEPDGPDQFHVVILDNGRSATLGSAVAEILYCIRCGACLNACPVYRHVGGHAYGSVYPGPIGKVLMPSLFGLEEWHDLPAASSLCGACTEACPVRIDIPKLLVELRNQSTEHMSWSVRHGIAWYARMATRPRLFRLVARGVGVAGRVLGRGGWLRRIPGLLRSWSDQRETPAPAPQTFNDWWRKRGT